MGKGVHLTELIVRMAKKYPIGVLNGEMTNEQLLIRVGCNLLDIDNKLWKKEPSLITDDELEKVDQAMNEALELKLHIYDNKYIDKIKNKVRVWVEKDGVKCVMADFLTLFKLPKHIEQKGNVLETQKISMLMDEFANLAKELKIPIILYVQMNRDILKRQGNKEPNLADIKQSGVIEELSYQVSFLHRPEYYDQTAVVDENGENIKGLMYQIIAKHRDGELGRLKYRAVLKSSKLESWETGYKNFIPMKNFEGF